MVYSLSPSMAPRGWLKVLSLDVKGLNNPGKWRAILRFLENSGADICLLPKTHLLTGDAHWLKSRKFPQQFFSSSGHKKAGVAILFSHSFRGSIGPKLAKLKGRLLAFDIGHHIYPERGAGTFYLGRSGLFTAFA